MSTRRSFLKTASAATAGLVFAPRIPAWADPAAGPVKVWGTFRDRRHAALENATWRPAGEVAATAIMLNPATVKQSVLGFGAAMTDAACYMLNQLSVAERGPVMHDLFAADEMAMTVCRTTIGASDYSRTLYSYDESETPDPELKKFSIDYDKAYILPMLREARKANPELFLFSSPWSPPGWMKPDHTMLGGAMRKLNFGPYAEYFRKFLEDYKAAGVAIDAVTVQNETDAEQEGRMPACIWAQEAEMEFVKSHLGPTLEKAGIDTKIWILDHNYSLWGRAVDELSDPGVYKYVDGVAWHGYVGAPDAMTRVHDAFPDKHAYWTEGGPDISQPDYQTDYTKWAETFNGILNNWARCITSWNMALDEKGKPNIGPFSCGGVITIDSKTHAITKSGQYWAFAHYSKHVKRGAKVFATDGIGSNGAGGKVTHTGFTNPDGSKVLVLANRGEDTRAQLVMDKQALEVELPADSVITLEWS